MKAVIQDIKEITDSREIMLSKPHPFIPVFIYLLITIIASAITWSYFGEIDDYVKVNGVVRPEEKVSTITNKVAGKVEEIYYEEGKKVKSGDILYTINYTSLNLEKETTLKELQKSQNELENLEKFRASVVDEKNYFNYELDNEKEYYNKYLKYETDLEIESNRVKLNIKRLNEVKDTLYNLSLLKESIKTNTNMFTDSNSVYHTKFEDYRYNLEKLRSILNQRKEAYESSSSLAQSGASSKKEVEDAKKLLESAELEVEKYKNEMLLSINTSIEENEKSKRELKINVNINYENSDSTALIIKKYRMDTIVQIDDSIKAMENKIESFQKNLESIEINITDCMVIAPKGGIVNVSVEASKGDYIPGGVEVATIVPETGEKYKIQLYLSNKDIASIKEGDTVKYHFLALAYKEYGELTGEIIKIGTDAKLDKQNGNSFYMVEASIENRPLYSYKGKEAEIKVGMVCEAQVITKTKRILYYLLEKINLRD